MPQQSWVDHKDPHCVDALGNPLRILLTGGNVYDISPTPSLITGLSANFILAGKAYDAQTFINLACSQGSHIVIPPRSNRREQRDYDRHIYKERHLVECVFAKLKSYRRISIRYQNLHEHLKLQ
ncbi:MAG: transposase [Nitrospinales bacterium]